MNEELSIRRRSSGKSMDRTPSEWEREFQAQQMAAMNEDLSRCRRSSGDSVAEANRTPSDWMKAFDREREMVMGSSATPPQGVLSPG